jgi:hypothetical protein
MPGDSSTVTFRLTDAERDLLEAVAHYSGETLSGFVRFTALTAAREVLKEVGPEAVTQGDENFEAQRQSKVHRRLKNRIMGLEKHASAGRPETTGVVDR